MGKRHGQRVTFLKLGRGTLAAWPRASGALIGSCTPGSGVLTHVSLREYRRRSRASPKQTRAHCRRSLSLCCECVSGVHPGAVGCEAAQIQHPKGTTRASHPASRRDGEWPANHMQPGRTGIPRAVVAHRSAAPAVAAYTVVYCIHSTQSSTGHTVGQRPQIPHLQTRGRTYARCREPTGCVDSVELQRRRR